MWGPTHLWTLTGLQTPGPRRRVRSRQRGAPSVHSTASDSAPLNPEPTQNQPRTNSKQSVANPWPTHDQPVANPWPPHGQPMASSSPAQSLVPFHGPARARPPPAGASAGQISHAWSRRPRSSAPTTPSPFRSARGLPTISSAPPGGGSAAARSALSRLCLNTPLVLSDVVRSPTGVRAREPGVKLVGSPPPPSGGCGSTYPQLSSRIARSPWSTMPSPFRSAAQSTHGSHSGLVAPGDSFPPAVIHEGSFGDTCQEPSAGHRRMEKGGSPLLPGPTGGAYHHSVFCGGRAMLSTSETASSTATHGVTSRAPLSSRSRSWPSSPVKPVTRTTVRLSLFSSSRGRMRSGVARVICGCATSTTPL